MARFRLVALLLAALVLLGACQRDGDSPTAATPAAPGEAQAPLAEFGAERTWQGVLPCSDCLGIDTRLVLREEGRQRRYRLEETYLGADEPNHFERQGQWQEARMGKGVAPTVVFVLDPEHAPRRFRLQPDGGLELMTAGLDAPTSPEYRLQRL